MCGIHSGGCGPASALGFLSLLKASLSFFTQSWPQASPVQQTIIGLAFGHLPQKPPAFWPRGTKIRTGFVSYISFLLSLTKHPQKQCKGQEVSLAHIQREQSVVVGKAWQHGSVCDAKICTRLVLHID